MQHSQNDFIVAVLLVIDSHQDGCDSATVKDEIDMYIDLFDEDLKPYGSRRKHEPRYRQLVGNLFSHRTPELFKYLNKTKINKRHYKWSLNTKGKIYVANIKKVKEAGKMLIEYSDASLDKTILIEPQKSIVSDIDKKKLDTVGEKRRITDSSLKDSILVIYGYTCQYGKLIGEKHQSFLREDGNPFMEVHHLIPMKASQDFFPRNLDRASNLVCLCPNCHERIHHGSKEEKEKVLKVLYNAMIDGLNYEEIYISYKQLLKYYL